MQVAARIVGGVGVVEARGPGRRGRPFLLLHLGMRALCVRRQLIFTVIVRAALPTFCLCVYPNCKPSSMPPTALSVCSDSLVYVQAYGRVVVRCGAAGSSAVEECWCCEVGEDVLWRS